MTLTWLQANIFPRVTRCRIKRFGAPEVLGHDADFPSLRRALVEAWPEPGGTPDMGAFVIELWDESEKLATVCPEAGVVLVGRQVKAALADRGILASYWLAQRGFPQPLASVQSREMLLLEASRTVLSHRIQLDRDAAKAHWKTSAPEGLAEIWDLLESQERESTAPLPTPEFETMLAKELARRIPDPLERAQALLIWMGRGFQKDQHLFAPHLLASVLYLLPDQLTHLAQHHDDAEVHLGFQVLLRSASTPLTRNQRGLRKALMAYLGL